MSDVFDWDDATVSGDYHKPDDAPVSNEPLFVRYHPRVQHQPGGPWVPPSIGNIQDGFTTAEQVDSLLDMLREHDGEYYAHARFRVVRITEEVVSEHS